MPRAVGAGRPDNMGYCSLVTSDRRHQYWHKTGGQTVTRQPLLRTDLIVHPQIGYDLICYSSAACGLHSPGNWQCTAQLTKAKARHAGAACHTLIKPVAGMYAGNKRMHTASVPPHLHDNP